MFIVLSFTEQQKDDENVYFSFFFNESFHICADKLAAHIQQANCRQTKFTLSTTRNIHNMIFRGHQAPTQAQALGVNNWRACFCSYSVLSSDLSCFSFASMPIIILSWLASLVFNISISLHCARLESISLFVLCQQFIRTLRYRPG